MTVILTPFLKLLQMSAFVITTTNAKAIYAIYPTVPPNVSAIKQLQISSVTETLIAKVILSNRKA